MRWYYTPQLGADLSRGFETFVKHDDSVDEHLDSLLKTIIDHEKQTGKKIDAQVATWRGCITKVRGGSAPVWECQLCAFMHRLTVRRSWRVPSMTGMGSFPFARRWRFSCGADVLSQF